MLFYMLKTDTTLPKQPEIWLKKLFIVSFHSLGPQTLTLAEICGNLITHYGGQILPNMNSDTISFQTVSLFHDFLVVIGFFKS